MIFFTLFVIGLMIGISTGIYYSIYGEDSFFEGFRSQISNHMFSDHWKGKLRFPLPFP